MTAKAISYAAVLERVAKRHDFEMEAFGTSTVTGQLLNEDAAALHTLAALVEKAEQNELEHIPVANRGDSVEIIRHVREGREVIADLAAGFSPAEADGR